MEEIKLPVIDDKMYAALRAPFPEEAYSATPQNGGMTSLKAYYVTERLNEVFGVGRWQIRVSPEHKTDDFIVLKGTFVSLDYDVANIIQFGGHAISGTGTDPATGYKSAVTDCQSKIASYLGVGHEMFKGLIEVPKEGDKKKAQTFDKNTIFIRTKYVSDSKARSESNSTIKALGFTFVSPKKVWAGPKSALEAISKVESVVSVMNHEGEIIN